MKHFAEGGRLNDELRYSAQVKNIKKLSTTSALNDSEIRMQIEDVCEPKEADGSGGDDTGDGGLSGGFTLFIQTPRKAGVNALTQEDLLAHSDLLEDISRIYVNHSK